MKSYNNQSGFSIIEISVIIVVIAIVGFLGYTAYNSINTDANNPLVINQLPTATDVKTAPELNSTSDLDEAESMLDQIDTSSSDDSGYLDRELSEF